MRDLSKSLTQRLFYAACLVLAAGCLLTSPLANLAGLTQPAEAALKSVYLDNLAGTYKVDGRNPNGSQYKGRVTITVKGDTAYFYWEIAGQSYSGQGHLQGSVLTIDWGSDTPVVYQVNPDGTLSGVWAGGKASEQLERIK